MSVPVLVSLVALTMSLLIAVVVAYIARQAVAGQGAGRIESDRRQDEMDPTLRKMNASQGADVTVQLSSPVGNSAHNIEVHHAGPAAAEIITVTSLDADNGRPCPIMRAWLELSRPPRAGVSKDVVAGLPPQSNRRLHVAVVWRDGNGSHRAESVLQV